MQGYEYFTSHFVDRDKTLIEVIWVDPKNPLTSLTSEVIQLDTEHPKYQELLQHVSLDEIHENTVNKMRQERADFEKLVIDIAKRDGILSDLITSKDNLHQAIVNSVFGDFDEVADREKLFSLKLTLFEQAFVKACEDRELKASLRTAPNFLETLKVAIKIYEAGEQ